MAQSRRTTHSLHSRLADAFRLPLALLTWNYRKTIYRWRGLKSRCPCQSPSDSGRAMETHCDAALDWNDPARFRLVCPALRSTADGYRCSLNARDVHPFWGRAIALWAGGVTALCLIVATCTFGAIHLGGNHGVSWLDVAWPPRWEEISRSRSRQFFVEALTAFEARNYGLARISLRTAVTSDRENYDAALMLAMWESQPNQTRDADRAFQWLIERHPEQATRSAIVFHDVLLAAGNPEKLTIFAAFMANRDSAHADLWIRALLNGLRLAGNAEKFSAAHAAELTRLPPPARALIATEILIQQGRLDLVRVAFQRPIPRDAPPVYGLLAVEQLLRLGEIATAVVWKNALAPSLGRTRALGLDYRIEALAHNESFARMCFAKLLDQEPSAVDADGLLALLVHAPDRVACDLLDRKLRGRSQPPEICAGMYMAALVCENRPAADHWAKLLGSQHHLTVPAARTVRFDTLTPDQLDSVPGWLNGLPLPRETIYALLGRVPMGQGANPTKESRALGSRSNAGK